MLTDIPLNDDYLNKLNAPQRQAVEHGTEPLLVLSGAGTGKTRVLTTRIVHLLKTRQAYASQILAVTFTNKASQEMRHRIDETAGPMAAGLWLGTFHALGAKILRIHGEKIGLSTSFTILSTDDQLRLIKSIAKTKGLEEKECPPRMILSVISRWKDRGLLPEQVRQHDGYTQMVEFYEIYQNELKRLEAVDFGDLTLFNLKLFREHPEVLKEYQHKFKFILVDEYQDTNVSQYLWLRLLAQGNALCCVGDDDQSIYGWRGAEVENILRFEKDFPTATLIRLEQNYRSTPHILGAASALIAQNRERLGKTLWTEESSGEKVSICGLYDSEEEGRYVSDVIENHQRNSHALREMAVLVRAGFQTREFEERFLSLGIPYRIVGGARFYERQEIRDAIAYLRFIAHPHDSLAFERILNVPRRGIGATTIQLLNDASRRQEAPLATVAWQMVETDEIKPQTRMALRRFLEQATHWRQGIETENPSSLAKKILEESGYLAMWKQDSSAEAPGRLENLREFISALNEFETLSAFLDHVSLVMENNANPSEDMVNIMTLHSAKGLEFETVFLCGWEEGLFPHPRALEEKGMAGLEEERRLAYVGITRARQRVYISFAGRRRVHNLWQSNPSSRFLSELPAEHVEKVSNSLSWKKPTFTPSFDGATSSSSYAQEPKFSLGERVFHIKFGYGTITHISGDHLHIHFEHSGDKKVMASFVEKS